MMAPSAGLDDIGLTMVKKDKIERFEQRSKSARVHGRERIPYLSRVGKASRFAPVVLH